MKYTRIINEGENQRKVKEDIIMMKSQRTNDEKDKT